jgi:copper chaperone CopZ
MFYIHNVPGRIRIVSEAIKRNPQAANEVRKGLSALAGVCTVHINLTTGSILIHYNPTTLAVEDILDILEMRGSTVQRQFQMMNISGRAFPGSGQQW